jgi:hypothetical protein
MNRITSALIGLVLALTAYGLGSSPLKAQPITASCQLPYSRVRVSACDSGLSTFSLDFAHSLYRNTAGYTRTNLVSWSQDATNAVWGKVNLTATSAATAAPDGTLTGVKIAESNTTLITHDLQRTLTVTASVPYARAVYLKQAERTQAEVQLFDGAAVNQFPAVDLAACTLVATNNATNFWIVPAANGWCRVGFSITPATTALQLHIYPAIGGNNNYAGTVGSGIYVWGDDVEQANSVGSYLPSPGASNGTNTYYVSANPADVGNLTFTSGGGYAPGCNGNLVSFAANVPRITCAGVLIEEARTNIARQSQNFSDVLWNKDVGVAIASTGLPAPDGTATASEVAYSGGAAGFALYLRPVTVSGTAYVWCLYVRSHTGTNQSFRLVYGAAARTGNLTATASWQRFCQAYTSAGTSDFAGVDGPGSYDLDVWQGDLQAGTFPTSPILTTSAAVTRPADVMSYGGLSMAYPLAMAAQVNAPSNAGQQQIAIVLDSGNANNRFALQYNAAQQGATFINSGGVAQANLSGQAVVAGQPYTLAVRVATNDMRLSSLGALNGNATTATLPVGNGSNLSLGSFVGATFLNGNVQQIRIYPYAANDNELAYRSAGNF